MTREDAITEVFAELQRAERKFPGFPSDPIHAAAIVAEECGELQRACLQLTYESGSMAEVEKEGVHAAAMALRFLFHLESLECRPSEQKERVSGSTQQAQPATPEQSAQQA